MKKTYYLLAIMFLDKNNVKGYHNIYVNVKGEFILSKVTARICRDYGYQKVTVTYRTEVSFNEFAANQLHNSELCCYVSND